MPSSSKIKVAQILEATGGGTRRHLRDLVSHLDPERFEVSVICSGGREADFDTDVRMMEAAGIRVYDLPMAPGFAPLCDWLAQRRMRRMLRDIQPDIVHTHSTKAGWIGRRAAHACGIRTIIHSPHCWPFQIKAFAPARWLVAGIERRLARVATAFICCCEAEKQAALKQCIAAPGQLHVIPNGICLGGFMDTDEGVGDVSLPLKGVTSARIECEWKKPCPARVSSCSDEHPAEGRFPENVRVVGVVGRLCRQKGQDWFLEAMAPAIKENPGLRIVLAGDGPRREKLGKTVRRLGIEAHCHFAGRMDDPRPLYCDIEVLVMPSRWEGLPYVLLDAMQAGKAIVATNIGGMGEALRGGAGILIEPGQAERLRQAVLELLENSEKREQLECRAVENAASYSLSKMVYDIQSVYTKFSRTQKSNEA